MLKVGLPAWTRVPGREWRLPGVPGPRGSCSGPITPSSCFLAAHSQERPYSAETAASGKQVLLRHTKHCMDEIGRDPSPSGIGNHPDSRPCA